MNPDNFILGIFVYFSTQSSLAFTWNKLTKINPTLFVYSHFLIFSEEFFIHKNGKSNVLSKAKLTLNES